MPDTQTLIHSQHLLKVSDLSATEIRGLLSLAADLKRDYARFAGALAQRSLVLLFEKPSLRTRVTFELGFQKLGGAVTFLDHQASPIGERETIEDYAGNLSRWTDAIAIRCKSHALLERFARASRVPVINALSDLHHPCQALADLFTLVETGLDPSQIHLAWVGDGNNVCHSLIETIAILGGEMTVITPTNCRPAPEVLRTAESRAFRSGARIRFTDDLSAVEGVNAIYTDVWVSMGEETRAAEKRHALEAYQVNASLMRKAGPQARFMHCLPARRGEEVTDDVIDSPESIVLDQAENRMHVQNALLLAMLKPDLAHAAIGAHTARLTT